MARQPWSEFVRNHPCAHLVVAFLDIDDIGTRRMRAMRDVLVSTIRRLAPSAIYGVAIVRARGAPEIHLAFADAADAILVSTALEAKVVNQCPGYASQRGFAFDDASAFGLRVALPPSALGESQRKSIRESAGMRTDPAVRSLRPVHRCRGRTRTLAPRRADRAEGAAGLRTKQSAVLVFAPKSVFRKKFESRRLTRGRNVVAYPCRQRRR